MLADKYRPSPFFPITSLQAQCFHGLTHSLAQRRTPISFTDNMFRTLSICNGGGTPLHPFATLPRRGHPCARPHPPQRASEIHSLQHGPEVWERGTTAW